MVQDILGCTVLGKATEVVFGAVVAVKVGIVALVP
jgi:hypothetical protein